jgi:hypothetical protein
MDLLFFGLPKSGLPKSHTQERHIGHVAETGELLESALRLVRQSPQLTQHEIHHIVGVALATNSIQIPGPIRFVRGSCSSIEPEQPFLGQRGEQLDREEGITAGLLVDRQR